LECAEAEERTDLLVTLMEMAVIGGVDGVDTDTDSEMTRH
jgi:hypothetical protein